MSRRSVVFPSPNLSMVNHNNIYYRIGICFYAPITEIIEVCQVSIGDSLQSILTNGTIWILGKQ